MKVKVQVTGKRRIRNGEIHDNTGIYPCKIVEMKITEVKITPVEKEQ